MPDDPAPLPAVDQPAATANGSPAPGDAAHAAPPAAAAPSRKKYTAELAHWDEPVELPADFAEAVLDLEKAMGMPVWLFVQDGGEHDLCGHVEDLFFRARHKLPQGSPVALLIESPGGQAECAYGIAKLLQKRCGSFVAVVANWAKSAATLLALGASEIVLAEHGQLGPLDAQLYDPGREEENSALNETQSLERLHAAGLEALVDTLYTLKMGLQARPFGGTKKFEALLPHAVKFVAESMRPLYEKVDLVQYTARLRDLKVAEEYAVRLLSPHYPKRKAEQLASALVENYPDHGFRIDFDEAKTLGMRVREPSPEQALILDRIVLHIAGMNAFGRVVTP